MSDNVGGEGAGSNGKVRDYGEVEARLCGLDSRHTKAAVIGEVETYAIHALEFGDRGEEGDKRGILLTGGVHGDEPAGVEAVLRFLEGPAQEYLDQFVFSVIPCVNPSGFELNTRVNSRDQDINRSMSADDVEEAVLLRQFLVGKRFDVFIDLHEDYEATGFYMYEAERQGRLIGARIVEAIKKIGSIDGDENSDAGLDLPISQGLFGINPNWRDKGGSQPTPTTRIPTTSSSVRPHPRRGLSTNESRLTSLRCQSPSTTTERAPSATRLPRRTTPGAFASGFLLQVGPHADDE